MTPSQGQVLDAFFRCQPPKLANAQPATPGDVRRRDATARRGCVLCGVAAAQLYSIISLIAQHWFPPTHCTWRGLLKLKFFSKLPTSDLTRFFLFRSENCFLLLCQHCYFATINASINCFWPFKGQATIFLRGNNWALSWPEKKWLTKKLNCLMLENLKKLGAKYNSKIIYQFTNGEKIQEAQYSM